MFYFICFLFFQAEDGIRDGHVTGVQTCALPILKETLKEHVKELNELTIYSEEELKSQVKSTKGYVEAIISIILQLEIGRASCRERVWSWGRHGILEKRDDRSRCRQLSREGAMWR